MTEESEDRATALKELADIELEIERNKTQAYIDEQQKREDEANKALESEKEIVKKRNEMAGGRFVYGKSAEKTGTTPD